MSLMPRQRKRRAGGVGEEEEAQWLSMMGKGKESQSPTLPPSFGAFPQTPHSEHSLTITAVRCAASQIPYLDLVSINKTGTLPWQPDCLFKLPLIDLISQDRLCLLNAVFLPFYNKSLDR